MAIVAGENGLGVVFDITNRDVLANGTVKVGSNLEIKRVVPRLEQSPTTGTLHVEGVESHPLISYCVGRVTASGNDKMLRTGPCLFRFVPNSIAHIMLFLTEEELAERLSSTQSNRFRI